MKIGIVGNGVSAITAVRELARIEPGTKIDVFTDESHAYYPRPKLIDYIAGRVNEREVIQYDHDWYEKQGAQLHLSEAVRRVDGLTRSVVTQSSMHSDYDRVLISVGSYPFVPPIKGVDKPGVHVLRTLDDATAIRDAAASSEKPIVIGGGILGTEMAAAMRERGKETIIVTNIDTILPAQLDREGSAVLMKKLERMGIDIRLGFTCKEVIGTDRVTGVVSTAGDEISGDLVIAATGVKPNLEVAKQTGAAVAKGVVVDEHMQTSVDGVFAAGDCIEWKGATWGIIPVALETAKIAAQNMIKLGSVNYQGTIPSNTLQVAGIDLTSIGLFNPQSADYESIVKADPSKGTYLKAVIKGGIVVGGIALGDRRAAMKLRGLVNRRTDVSASKKTVFDSA